MYGIVEMMEQRRGVEIGKERREMRGERREKREERREGREGRVCVCAPYPLGSRLGNILLTSVA